MYFYAHFSLSLTSHPCGRPLLLSLFANFAFIRLYPQRFIIVRHFLTIDLTILILIPYSFSTLMIWFICVHYGDDPKKIYSSSPF